MDGSVKAQAVSRIPRSPDSIAESGIGSNGLLRIMLKSMYVSGMELPSELAEQMKVGRNIVLDLLDEGRDQSLVETRGSAGAKLQAEVRHGLTDRGQEWSAEALDLDQYIGPAPVSLKSYKAQVRKQPLMGERIAQAKLEAALSEFVVPDNLVRRLGQAINSARSLLLYGAPGNGKTAIAEIIGGIFKEVIFIPYCIEVDGKIIKVFDPAIHERVTDPEELLRALPEIADCKVSEVDQRWVPCRRPAVRAGGELTLEMLDLQFNPYSKFYEAPLHMKAIGGSFLIDDLGRQLVQPEDLLNRWITPMEKRVDYLTLNTGRTFTIPFDELVIFATNLTPDDLMDPAFLRRIPYKVRVMRPSPDHYRLLFRMLCEKHEVPHDEEMVAFVMDKIEKVLDQPLAFYQPGFIVEQILSACKYDGSPPRMDRELLIDALDNISLQEGAVARELASSSNDSEHEHPAAEPTEWRLQ